MVREALESYTDMDEFFRATPMGVMYWFFQRREPFLAQKTMTKWSRDRIDDYVLLPATPGFVTRTECFFVSHFWHSSQDPDPGGKYLQLMQHDLEQQPWSFIWVDWSCVPQHPRSPEEEAYFTRVLQTMSAIIRNSGFMYFYPPFEPRLWILYEVAEQALTSVGVLPETPDYQPFIEHVREMERVSVRPTLERHGYRCTYDGDRDFLVSWLELLVLLKRLSIYVDDIRRMLDYQTWSPTLIAILHQTWNGQLVQIRRFEGVVE
ncbi:uncharacterized protein PG986_013734 [Apiospora aurea]|uniref:Heterokaryon incompatibility domain-containing protein n=1 Tax=Apiospora aurea TaxID=335848 RepID=A0ABR1PWG7_9PEZI